MIRKLTIDIIYKITALKNKYLWLGGCERKRVVGYESQYRQTAKARNRTVVPIIIVMKACGYSVYIFLVIN